MLIISGKARCIARLDPFDKFCDLLPAILTAIEMTAKSKIAYFSKIPYHCKWSHEMLKMLLKYMAAKASLK